MLDQGWVLGSNAKGKGGNVKRGAAAGEPYQFGVANYDGVARSVVLRCRQGLAHMVVVSSWEGCDKYF